MRLWIPSGDDFRWEGRVVPPRKGRILPLPPFSHKPFIPAVASVRRVTGSLTFATVVPPGTAERESSAEPSPATSATPPLGRLTNTLQLESAGVVPVASAIARAIGSLFPPTPERPWTQKTKTPWMAVRLICTKRRPGHP